MPADNNNNNQHWLLLLSAVLACLPHVSQLSLFFLSYVGFLFAWRAWCLLGDHVIPSRRVLSWLTVVGFFVVLLGEPVFLGRSMGIGLLVLALAIKLLGLETSKVEPHPDVGPRDMLLVLSFGFMVAILSFLHSESYFTISMVAFSLFVMLYAGALFYQRHSPSLQQKALLSYYPDLLSKLRPVNHKTRSPFGILGFLIKTAVLTAIMIAVFPFDYSKPGWAVPVAPFWGKPGISDQLTPGKITRLSESSEVVFRVRFEKTRAAKTLPAPQQLQQTFWRGPVLSQFTGKGWRRPTATSYVNGFYVEGKDLLGPNDYAYTVELEPQNKRWLFALAGSKLIADNNRHRKPILSNQQEWVFPGIVAQALRYRMQMVSSVDKYKSSKLNNAMEYLHLPRQFATRARTLAADLVRRQNRNAAVDALTMKQIVLDYFRQKPFYYSKQPPPLGSDPVDDFLFNTRTGYCEHYASSFTVLMRAAGIPARVVTGYYGGEYNQAGSYLVVRQSQAHAWSEIWVQGQGWHRVDPTAVIPDHRILDSADNIVGQLNQWSTQLAGQWGERLYQWQGLLSALAPTLNSQWFKQHFVTLLLFVMAIIAALGFTRFLSSRKTPGSDPCVYWYERFGSQWEASDLCKQPYETASEYADRLSQARPELKEPIAFITQAYNQLRYAETPPVGLMRSYKKAIREVIRGS